MLSRTTVLAISLERENEPRWLKRILGATLVFNLFDIILTLSVVLFGRAAEANPVMATLLANGPLSFTLGKIGLVSLGVWVLWKARTHRLAIAGSVGVFLIYAMLMVYHVQSVQALIDLAT